MNHTLLRVITSVILLTIVSVCAYSGLQNFIYLVHIFIFLLQIELALLLFKPKYSQLILPFVGLTFLSTFIFNYYTIQFLPLFFLFIAGSISLLLILYSHLQIEELGKLISKYILGFVYGGCLPAITTKIMMVHDGINWLILALAVVFAGDIAAYFVGRKFGSHKIFPTISPNKSWEGAWGGLIASIATGATLGKYLFPEVSITVLLIAALVAGLLAQSGDFFESLLKRLCDKKDSGILLPGHGGFLDRFDGILFALPVYYYLAF